MKNRIRDTSVFLSFVLAVTMLVSLPAFDHFHGLDIDVLHWLRANFSIKEKKRVESPTVVVAIDEITQQLAVLAIEIADIKSKVNHQ